jgi:Zn-dependent protease with chaperone function
MSVEQVWRHKSDAELAEARHRIWEYTEEGQGAIQAEIERRTSPEYIRARQAARARSAQLPSTMSLRTAPENQSAWLAQRVFLALALMVGFYMLALAIAIGLLWIPYAEWTYGGRIHIKIAIVCVGGALAVLWALVPRIDRFEPPGPRLEEATHPGLFNVIRQIAGATNQAVPTDVYLVNEVNAWVTHRGGTMGFGSHRVMGVGLPLLQVLSVSEFKAIVAHEFGHYSSGDVKLGPWIYKTRAAIGRTIAGVEETWIEAPFQWYGQLFLRLTHGVSRQQEFIADQIAARVAGAPAMASALRRVTALAPVFSVYLREEVVPVLQAGFMPPIAAGFNRFLATGHIIAASEHIVEAAENESQTDIFDTHPSLRDRLAALGSSKDGALAPDNSAPAYQLVPGLEDQAYALVESSFGSDGVVRLKRIEWELVADAVYAEGWRNVVRNYSQWLRRLTADGFPIGKSAFIRLGSDLVRADEQNINNDIRIERAVHLLGAGIGVLLIDKGWRPQTSPGAPMVVVRDSESFDPLNAVRQLAKEEIAHDAWKAQCRSLGIAGLTLGVTTPTEVVKVAGKR